MPSVIPKMTTLLFDMPMTTLDIITQTDFAGAIDATYHCPGAAKVAGFYEQIRSENPDGTLILDAGDILCAAPICNLTDGTPVVQVCNTLGFDAMTLGNHEFDNGFDAMCQVLSKAEFPILCANIRREDTGKLLPFAKPWIMLERQGIRIGVIGLTTAYTPYMVKSFEGFLVDSPADVLRELIPQVRSAGADLIIVLGHLPCTMLDGSLTGELWETYLEAPGADIMIGGHNVGDVACIHNDTVFVKAGFSVDTIGHVRLTLDEHKNILSRKVRTLDMMTADIPKIQPVQEQVDSLMAPFRPILDRPLAELPVQLNVDCWNECALGNFYTAGLAAAAGAQIGFFNSTSIFGYMPAGTVTREMITHVMCFDEDIYEGFMTGAQLRELFSRTYEWAHWENNRGIQFTGLRVVVDSRLPADSRVISLTLADGTPVEADQRYHVATTDYIALGGNDYRGITDAVDWKNTHVRTHSFFIDYLEKLGKLPHETDGRLVNLDPDWEARRTCFR